LFLAIIVVGFRKQVIFLGEQAGSENTPYYYPLQTYECIERSWDHYESDIHSYASVLEIIHVLKARGCTPHISGRVHITKVMTSKSKAKAGSVESSIRKLSKRSRGQLIRRVCDALETRYRNPRHRNPKNPLDDLIYIILSNKTGQSRAVSVYTALKNKFESWDELCRRRNSVLERILRPAGLSRIKSAQIRSALKQIRSDFGSCSLRRLAKLTTHDAESYLTSLPGVSDKVAKCVLMYTCGAQVLPVDAHIHRIARRLGWTIRKRADQCHSELESLIPPQRRYSFHVNCVAHGRLICRPSNPNCKDCCISKYCDYNKHEFI